MGRRPEHAGVAPGGAAEAVGGRIGAVVGLGLDDDPAGRADEQAGADQVGGHRGGAAGEEGVQHRVSGFEGTVPAAKCPIGTSQQEKFAAPRLDRICWTGSR